MFLYNKTLSPFEVPVVGWTTVIVPAMSVSGDIEPTEDFLKSMNTQAWSVVDGPATEEEQATEEERPAVDVSSMNKAQLHAELNRRGIVYHEGMKNDELRGLLS